MPSSYRAILGAGHPFLAGMASAFDLSGFSVAAGLPPHRVLVGDAEAIWSDWAMVAGDLRLAVQEFEREHEIHPRQERLFKLSEIE